jgi:SAM-dependent methyltransferase
MTTLSIPQIHEAVVSTLEEMRFSGGAMLDIGSGDGSLITLIRSRYPVQARACDYLDTLMKLEDVPVDLADLNSQPLPYQDGTFDLITCTEVIEHLEHYRFTLREIFRVLKPGGILVLSTPNILNLKSRMRFLGCGFWNLFGPLHVRESRMYGTGGHINPVSYFFVAHALSDAGFDRVQVRIDKVQRSSAILGVFLAPWVWLHGWLAFRTERRRRHTIDKHNAPFVAAINRWDLLTGRTIVVGAQRPGPKQRATPRTIRAPAV